MTSIQNKITYPCKVWVYDFKFYKSRFVYNATEIDMDIPPREGRLIGIVNGVRTILIDSYSEFSDLMAVHSGTGFFPVKSSTQVECEYGLVLFEGDSQPEKIEMKRIMFKYIKPMWEQMYDELGLIGAVNEMIYKAKQEINDVINDQCHDANVRLDRNIDKMEDRFNQKIAEMLTDSRSHLSHWGKNYQHSRKDVIKWTKHYIEPKIKR